MNVLGIVKEWLESHRHDGLYNPDACCGCQVSDLAPCGGEDVAECLPGHKIPCDPETCDADGDCPWHIGVKPEGDGT
jgi:hypothetical protein